MKVFLDTNVLAAALGTRGLCADLFAVIVEEHTFVICEQLLVELQRVLQTKFRLPAALIEDFIGFLKTHGLAAQSDPGIATRCPDPDDAPLLQAAVGGRAEFFVTGDKALLKHASARDLVIISPRELWVRLR